MSIKSHRIPFQLCLSFIGILGISSEENMSVFENRYSVTNFQGLELYYTKLKKRNVPIWAKSLPRSTSQICRQIFYKKFSSSEYFVGASEIKMIRKYNYKTTKLNRSRNRFARSKLRTISVNENIRYDEDTFDCSVYNFIQNTIESYYVSKYSYNVNEVLGGEYIKGRFIFARRAKLVVHALAEEYARELIYPEELEKLYIQRRSGHLPAEDVKNDPVCKLDKARRSRICNSVTMDESIRSTFKVTFEGECEKKVFSLEKYPQDFEEWMLICKTTGVINEKFYVSRSYAHNEVFVFKILDQHLRLEFLALKIGVVVDDPVRIIERVLPPSPLYKRLYSECNILR